jgi:hypothetical protein
MTLAVKPSPINKLNIAEITLIIAKPTIDLATGLIIICSFSLKKKEFPYTKDIVIM